MSAPQTKRCYDTTKSTLVSPTPPKARDPPSKNKKGHEVEDAMSLMFDPTKMSFLPECLEKVTKMSCSQNESNKNVRTNP